MSREETAKLMRIILPLTPHREEFIQTAIRYDEMKQGHAPQRALQLARDQYRDIAKIYDDERKGELKNYVEETA